MIEITIDNKKYYYLATFIYVKTEEEQNLFFAIDKYETLKKYYEFIDEQIKEKNIYEFYKDYEDNLFVKINNELKKIEEEKKYNDFNDILKYLNIMPNKINKELERKFLSIIIII